MVWIRTRDLDSFECKAAEQGWAATLHRETYKGQLLTATYLWHAHGDTETQRHIWIAAGMNDLRRYQLRLGADDLLWTFERAVGTLLAQHDWWGHWHHTSSALPGHDDDYPPLWSTLHTNDDFLDVLAHQLGYVQEHWTVVRIHQTPTGLRLVE